MRTLVAKGALGGGVLDTDDCRATHDALVAKGVIFLQEPAERPYGVEALFRDDSGNWFSLDGASVRPRVTVVVVLAGRPVRRG